jgi:hypothetical protein
VRKGFIDNDQIAKRYALSEDVFDYVRMAASGVTWPSTTVFQRPYESPRSGDALSDARLFMSEGDHGLDPSRSSSREIPGGRDGNQQRYHRDTDRHRIVRIDAVE